MHLIFLDRFYFVRILFCNMVIYQFRVQFPIGTFPNCPVCWGCKIHRLLLCIGLKPPQMSVLHMTPNSLMDAYSFLISSLGSKPLYKVINFLTVLFICLISYRIHFKNSSEYFTREFLIYFWRFRECSVPLH